MSAIPTAVREATRAREGGRCARCSAGGATDHHHRMRRREGGHGKANLVLLCRVCHSWAHANPSEARAEGYIVPTWMTSGEIASVPVKKWYGWCFFDGEGEERRLPPADTGLTMDAIITKYGRDTP